MKYKGRIFLLDDDKLIVSMLSRSLNKEGYETQVHSSAINIVPQIAEWQPDLLLLDIHLDNEINGIDVLREIRDLRLWNFAIEGIGRNPFFPPALVDAA